MIKSPLKKKPDSHETEMVGRLLFIASIPLSFIVGLIIASIVGEEYDGSIAAVLAIFLILYSLSAIVAAFAMGIYTALIEYLTGIGLLKIKEDVEGSKKCPHCGSKI